MSWWSRARTFWTETKAEMSKVTFPSREDVINLTMVVLVASFVFAAFLWLSDLLINWLYQSIFDFFTT